MQNSAKATLTTWKAKDSVFTYGLHVVLGSIFLALISQISLPLPFTPVPLTFQSLGILLLAMAQGKNKAAFSVIAYLGQATAGLPVLAGGLANPAWMVGPRCGYLLGFVAAAYVVGLVLEKTSHKSWSWKILSLAVGELTILTVGTAVLTLFFGFGNAVALGFVPFLINAAIKISIAASADKPLSYIQKAL